MLLCQLKQRLQRRCLLLVMPPGGGERELSTQSSPGGMRNTGAAGVCVGLGEHRKDASGAAGTVGVLRAESHHATTIAARNAHQKQHS